MNAAPGEAIAHTAAKRLLSLCGISDVEGSNAPERICKRRQYCIHLVTAFGTYEVRRPGFEGGGTRVVERSSDAAPAQVVGEAVIANRLARQVVGELCNTVERCDSRSEGREREADSGGHGCAGISTGINGFFGSDSTDSGATLLGRKVGRETICHGPLGRNDKFAGIR